MKRAFVLVCTISLAALARPVAPQPTNSGTGLVGTWALAAVERNVSGDEPERVRGARGVLIFDAAGNVFEYFSTTGRDEPESALADPRRTFANVGGFWGRYENDSASGRIHFEANDGVSPSVRSLEFTREYDLDGDWLVIASAAEPQAQADTRWTWQRQPIIEGLGPTYEGAAGFWEHIEEGPLAAGQDELENPRHRAPSVIVYTPSGFVGVHFPPQGREAFAGAIPTEEEARAALRGYIGYFGTLNVYPGEVAHNVLSGISPTTGAILRRYAEVDGDELIVRLQSLARQSAGRPASVTIVRLRRLSGLDDMLPRDAR